MKDASRCRMDANPAPLPSVSWDRPESARLRDVVSEGVFLGQAVELTITSSEVRVRIGDVVRRTTPARPTVECRRRAASDAVREAKLAVLGLCRRCGHAHDSETDSLKTDPTSGR